MLQSTLFLLKVPGSWNLYSSFHHHNILMMHANVTFITELNNLSQQQKCWIFRLDNSVAINNLQSITMSHGKEVICNIISNFEIVKVCLAFSKRWCASFTPFNKIDNEPQAWRLLIIGLDHGSSSSGMLSRDDIYFCILRIFQEENWPNALIILGQKLPTSYIHVQRGFNIDGYTYNIFRNFPVTLLHSFRVDLLTQKWKKNIQ